MSVVSNASRDFNKAISSALGANVKVYLEIDYPAHYVIGKLNGFEIESQGIVLQNAKDDKNNKYDTIFIHGGKWVSFSMIGEAFPIDALAARLRKMLPGDTVTLQDDDKISILGGKIIVTEQGVEGRGPTRERIQKVYDSFIAEIKKN